MARRRAAPGIHWDSRIAKYVGQWMEAGRRRTRVLSRDKETAERIFRQIKTDAEMKANGLGALVAQHAPLASLEGAYLADLATRASSHHLEVVRANLRDAIRAVGVSTVAELTVERALEAQRHLLTTTCRVPKGAKATSRKLSRETVNKKLASLRACLNWGVSAGIIAVNPLAGARYKPLPTTKDRARVRHVFSREEARAVLAAAIRLDRRSGPHRVPQAPLLRLLLGTGFRLGEAFSLRWSSLTMLDGTWRLTVEARDSKTGTARTNPIDARLHRDLMRLRARQGRLIGRLPGPLDSILLTPRGHPWAGRSNSANALRWLNRVLEEAGLPKQRPDGTTTDFYSFRHTYCTWLRMSGVGYSTARDLMGHSDEGITRAIYTRSGMVVEPKIEAMTRLSSFLHGHREARSS